MSKKLDIKVDAENMCIDRSTELGEMFAKLNEMVASSEDPGTKEFLSKVSAYVEAGLIVENTLPEDEAKVAIEKLKQRMASDAQVQ